jgi:hypothetical protein
MEGERMYRFIALISLIGFIFVGAACDDNAQGRKFGGRTWSSSLSPDDEALERSIIADVMGGIAAEAIDPSEMSLAGLALLDEPDTGKISISAPLERALTSVTDAFTYEGPAGGGTLTIRVHGQAEEINIHTETNRKLRFYPIEVVFSFDNYIYVNSCGLEATVTGNLSCRMQGDVTRSTDVFTGIGSCASGTEGMTGTLLYRLSDVEYHDVVIQATVRADGPWYELTSYKFYGTYMLDRRTGTLDSVVAKPPMLCEDVY